MIDLRDQIDSLPRDKKIVVLCHKGKQSPKAAAYLSSNKDLNVMGILEGGLTAWEKAGLPVDKG